MRESRYKAAIIGTGGISRAHAGALAAHADRVELVAAVDIDGDRAREFADRHGVPRTFTDPEAMLARVQPDIVHVCTPPGLHAEQSVAAMEAGAWVLCEKPLCASLAEMDRIEAGEAATGNYTSSVFQWRFGSGGRHLKELIRTEAMGRLLVANVLTTWYRGDPYFAVRWRSTWKAAVGGCTVVHGIHIMDFALWLIGEWSEIRAMMATLAHDIEVENVSMASVRFDGGAMASFSNSILSPRQESVLRLDFADTTVEMTRNVYTYGNQDWSYSTWEGSPHAEAVKAWGTLPPDIPASHVTQVGSFLDSRDRNERPEVSGADIRGTIEFLTAFYKSAVEGRPVLRGEIQPGDPWYRLMNGQFHLLDEAAG